MDTRWLEDVLALLEEGTLNRAAARRNVTQPAFSRRIRAFEDWIGASMLDRQVNRIALHPALSEHETEMRAILNRLAELRETLATHEGKAKKITVVSQHALSAGTFPEICRTYVERQPDLVFRLRTLNRRECISAFLRAEADILLCYKAPDFPPMPFEREILAKLWRQDFLVPLVATTTMAGLEGTDPRYADLPFIAYPDESYFGRLIAEAGERTDRLGPTGQTRVTSAFSFGVLQLARAGLGVGWVPTSLAASHLASGELVSLEDHFGKISVDITLYSMRSNRLGSALLS